MQLRVMTQQDIPGGVRLNTVVGWNQTDADWERFLTASPNGCFVMDDNGKIVGTAATISYENRFAWIGMVLVDPEYRNRGIGTSLLRRTIEYLDAAGIPTLKLDATPAGKPLYEKLGFVTEYEIDRWILKRTSKEQSTARNASLSAEHLPRIFKHDNDVFGADRSALLHSLEERAADLTLAKWDGQDLRAYVFGRRGLFADHLGPWMARDAATAKALLSEFLHRSPRDTIIVDALKSKPTAGELLREQGFSPVRLLTRMYRGPNAFPGKPNSLYAIVGPEFG
ncbi:MAG TPA: GNAT family N-acetyltransferase [Candidatus Acidoferrum sp.]|jgi:GNAT superfamily N-acetyltransferase